MILVTVLLGMKETGVLHQVMLTCVVGYTCDMYCLVYTQCDIDQCQNGGICVKLGVSYMCNCLAGYTGTLCETGKNCKTCIECTTCVEYIYSGHSNIK